jgi:hypothetical protein
VDPKDPSTPEQHDETTELTTDETTEMTSDPTATLPAEQPGTAALPAEQAATTLTVAPELSAPEPDASGAPPMAVTSDVPPPDAGVARTSGPRMRTIVFGLVLLAISITGLVRMLTDVHVDDAAVLLTLLIVAGALLLGGGVASAVRESRMGRRRY